MIDYYWQNEASLNDCEKADLLEEIWLQLLDVDTVDAYDEWEIE